MEQISDSDGGKQTSAATQKTGQSVKAALLLLTSDLWLEISVHNRNYGMFVTPPVR